MIVASITLPDALLTQIREHVEKQDLSMSQYIRKLAREDLREKAAA